MTTIILHRQATYWAIEWTGPQAREISRMFGTAVLPTRWRADTEPGVVRAEIARRNPGYDVVFRDPSDPEIANLLGIDSHACAR